MVVVVFLFKLRSSSMIWFYVSSLKQEGLILEGTPAAEGVSATDMSKRKR